MLEKRKRKITFDSRRDNFLLKNVKTRHKFIYDEEANIIRENRALPVYEYTWIGSRKVQLKKKLLESVCYTFRAHPNHPWDF